MSSAGKALRALAAARNERDRARARAHFEAALSAGEAWRAEEAQAIDAALFCSRVLAEYAAEQDQLNVRLRLFRRSLSLAEATWKQEKVGRVAETHSLVSIDLFQDSVIGFDARTKQSFLHKSKDMLDAAIRDSAGPKERAQLLARKSAILRHQAQLELSPASALRRLNESVACAEKATSDGHFPSAYLELGLAEWARSRREKTDEGYAEWLRRAEAHLRETAKHVDDNATLALARFYRMNYRPLEACESFPTEQENIRNLRKVLREAYLYGEAVTQLWFAGAANEVLDEKLATAKRLLHLSLAAGNRNARMIVSLGFVSAILDGPDAGAASLSEISNGPHQVSWTRAITVAANATQEKIASFGFALGIGSSEVWTSLGTYAATFMDDRSLVETLYREAVQLDPGNAVALTNLARFLVSQGTMEALLEAKKLITRAASHADRRFFWWRDVKTQVDTELESYVPAPTVSSPRPTSKVAKFEKVYSLKELPVRFATISQVQDIQQRGYLLEALFYEAANLEFAVAKSSYRIHRIESLIQQVDGYIEHRVNKYRVECKWTKSLMDAKGVILFNSRLDAAGVDGIFISMAGFTDSAVTAAKLLASQKAILLVDGAEISEVFNLRRRLGDMLSIKRQYFDMRTQVYHRLKREVASI